MPWARLAPQVGTPKPERGAAAFVIKFYAFMYEVLRIAADLGPAILTGPRAGGIVRQMR